MTEVNETAPRGMSTASLVLGIVSIVCGFAFVVPLVGVIFGVIGRRNEPAGRTRAAWGIGLNLFALLAWVVFLILVITLGLLEVAFNPAAHHS